MSDIFDYGKQLTLDERSILISQSVSTIGDFMALPAFLVIVQSFNPELVSVFLFFYFFPRFFQPVLGYLSDRYNPRTIVLLTEALRGSIFLILFLIPIKEYFVLWLVLIVLNSFLGSLFDPARIKLMTLVSRNFTHYNSIFNFFFSFMGIFAIFFSIFIELNLKTEYVFFFNAITFYLSMLFLSQVELENSENSDVREKAGLIKLFAGIKFFKKPLLGYFLLGIVFVDFFTGVLYQDFPAKSLQLKLENIGSYLFTLILCLGNSLGALAIPVFSRHKRLYPWTVGLAAAACFIFLYANVIALVMLSCFIFFVLQMILIGMIEVEIESEVPECYQGRVFALGDSLPILALSLGGMVSQVIGNDGLSAILFFGSIGILILSGVVSQLRPGNAA